VQPTEMALRYNPKDVSTRVADIDPGRQRRSQCSARAGTNSCSEDVDLLRATSPATTRTYVDDGHHRQHRVS
jgi:hypothetical protein